MKNLIFIAILLLCCYPIAAQVNYVLNPSLEQHDSCPYSGDQIKFATYWQSLDSPQIYQYASDGEPEYLNTCGTGIGAVPYNGYFHHYPRTGNGMAQVGMFSLPNFISYLRDYLQGHLYKPLTAGTSYCVTFYVALENGSDYANNHIGAYLDNGMIDTTVLPGLPQTEYTPYLQALDTSIIIDTLNWTKIEGSFIANGTEKFITIGNFYSDSNTDIVSTGFSTYPNALYLVDDISVIESDTKAFAWGTDTLYKGYLDSFLLGRNETIPGIKWYRDGVLIDTLNGGIWCKDDTVGSYHMYIVSQTLCGITTYDTVVVSVELVSVRNIKNMKDIIVYPNPVQNELVIENAANDLIRIYDVMGR